MNSIESESLNDNRNQTARSETTLNNLRNQAKKLGWIEVTKNVYKTNNGNHIHLTGFNEKTKKYFFEKKDDIPSPEEFDDMSLSEKKNSNLSEDELKRKMNEIQKSTDNNIDKINKILEAKKIDILKV